MNFEDIKGLGQKRVESLRRAGFSSPEDLLFFFPKKYVDTQNVSRVQSLNTGDEAVFWGRFEGEPVRKTVRSGLFFVRVVFATGNGEKINCIWFNNKYIRNIVALDKEFYIFGTVKRVGNRIEMSAPELLDGSYSGVIPIYKRISGCPSSLAKEAISKILSAANIRSYINEDIANEFSLMPLSSALKGLHAPKSIEEAETAALSVAIEALSNDLAVFFHHKDSAEGKRFFLYADKVAELEYFIKTKLPYSLTTGQQTALGEIIRSLLSGERMNRLLQGDVGSGKTIIAFMSMYFAYLNGYQSVLMAPTEILANQHFASAVDLFGALGVKICLLTGSVGKRERQDKLFNIKHHLYDFVIGTHSVISEDVEFAKLALVVTDEQQRFGVGQRGKLENKSFGTDCLILTATPIPRTLSLILYGELNQSVIDSVPDKKAKILTRAVSRHKLGDMYKYIADRAAAGENTYIVCPRIEKDEDEELNSAKEVYSSLKKREDMAGFLGLLHGQMKEDEKNSVMSCFHDGKIRILVSTTVIEVGVDVPSATSMVIFNPERYGLSQLHQLRGRIGRGMKDSYCFVVADEDVSDDRLNVFLGCSDGFTLAEYDFENRGAGDFLGIRQHGNAGTKNAKITPEMILKAKNIAQKMLLSVEASALIGNTSGEKTSFIKSITLN